MSAESHSDEGFTLVELIVTCMLISLVMGIIVSMFISTSTAQQSVGSMTTSANNAQLTATNISRSVQNSSEFMVNTDNTLLIARVAGSDAAVTYGCSVWFYDAATKSIRTTTAPLGSTISVPTAAALKNWQLLVEKVQPGKGTGVFAKSGTSLDIAFSVVSSGMPLVAIETQAAQLFVPAVPETVRAKRCFG